MNLDSLIKPFVSIAYFITKIRAKRLGYEVNFKNLPKTWIQAKVIYEMDSVWKRMGLDATGINYFTFGAIENSLSSRFNSKSPYFQAWLGGYIVKFNQKKDWGINDHFKLGEADQRNWLWIYGDSKPRVDIDFGHVENLGPVEVSGFKGKLYRGNIFSDTDIGTGKISIYNRLQISGLAIYFNKTNLKLNLNSKNLIPKWTKDNLLNSYERIHLRGYIAILNINDSIKAVLYTNAANFKDSNGNLYDNFKKLDEELLQLIKDVEIKNLRS